MSYDEAYEGIANELVKRITALIPEHPEILKLNDPWKLFKVPGFNCKDLGPSLFQAGWALARAIQLWEVEHGEHGIRKAE
jgi:hypothetical protein